jgi:hypothetical protein
MSDATPAYRGYRLQTLYIIWRILEPNSRQDLIFQPEGVEDFSIWDANDNLLETVQVKAYGENLTLSLLSPEKVDSFLYRTHRSLDEYPRVNIKIASFGDIGSELRTATQENGRDSSKVQHIARKIARYKFLAEADARRIIERLQIVRVSESNLEEQIFATLQNLCTGIDPIPAFDILNSWIYRCAENRSKISQNDLIQKINDVGKFIAERHAHHAEWFRSIVPIENKDIDDRAKERLSDEFYRGISAKYDHILAGVDKPRTSKLNEISQKFKDKQVVIIHGASGQGKTTIAYRYLHDFFPDLLRFQIQLVENRQQALNIATALSGHAKAVGIPIAVYLDIGASDIGWVELIEQLSSHKNIQILATVREEDFRRANISNAEIQFAEVELQFDRSEAEEIYQRLVETQTPTQFLDFDDAWNRFGGEGLLMEFVYLVTQGDSLRERLQQQVRRIQDEVRAGRCSDIELAFLRLVSVASAFEARLKLKEIVNFLQLSSPQRTLELLEKEYLLRTSEDGALVGALHPIRSMILAEILTDRTFYPWADSASTCLPFIFERDIGSFLLYAFSRHRLELEPLLSALNTYQPRQWIAIAGVIHALIWLGLKEYVEENRQSIEDAYELSNHAWWIFIDFSVHNIGDITKIDTNSSKELEELMAMLMPHFSENQHTQINYIKNCQTDKINVFTKVTKWLSLRSDEPLPPQSELDWTGMAESLFWVGWLNIPLPISDWLAHIDLDLTTKTLPLEILADLILGLFYSDREAYYSWLNTNYAILIGRFRQETRTVRLEDDGQNIMMHFVVGILQPNASISECQDSQQHDFRNLNNISVRQLELLRRFFPNRELYGSQGYGHLVLPATELPDDTNKNIPCSNLPIQWLVSINSMFIALGEQYLRPNSWEVYTQSIVNLRQKNLQVLSQINQGLEIYFRQQEIIDIFGNCVELDSFRHVQQLLELRPFLPRCAFDEWGFISDSIDRQNRGFISGSIDRQNKIQQNQNLALEKYNSYIKSFNEYTRTLTNFFNQADWVIHFHPRFRNGANETISQATQKAGKNLNQQAHLSVLNLGDAWKSLSKFQVEFRIFLSPFVKSKELDTLELLEQSIFDELWYSWYFFAFHPERRFKNAAQDSKRQFNKKVKEITDNIRREVQSISSENIQICIISENIKWEEEPSLWLKIDGKSALEVYESAEVVVKKIQKAIGSVDDNELRRYSIELTWSNIAIVPLVKGKSLDATAWRFSSNLLSNPEWEIGWLNFIPTAIPSNAFARLKFSKWNYPQLTIAQKIIGLIYQPIFLVTHIQDFGRLPELDEEGYALLQAYIQQFNTLFSEVRQNIIDVKIEFFRYCNELSSSEKVIQSDSIAVLEELVKLLEQIFPNTDYSDEEIERSMNLEEVIEWVNRFNSSQHNAFSTYLNLASNILELE